MIERWLGELERELRVHGRRRKRVVEELAGHLHEAAATHGEAGAVSRVGDPGEVARSFTPQLLDRVFEQRDRLAALTMLAAMAASLPLAVDLRGLGERAGSQAWLWFFLFLAPTALVALVSCLAVLRRHELGARLARSLVAMVTVTALVVVLDLPPAAAEFSQYRQAVTGGHDTAGCAGRSLVACADDHVAEIRINYSLGAVVLSLVYLWAVTGWTPRRRRPQRVLA
ncbi:MAG: hypothetical protein QOG33_1384 [Gaiellales bacterium]|jgi:hypothetical protein|nr:hypothetical protein [Gaiellales bacterium]